MKRIVSVFLSAFMMLSVASVSFADVAAERNRLKQVEQEQASLKDDIRSTQSKAEGISANIVSIDKKLTDNEVKLTQIENEILFSQQKIEASKQQIAELEQNIVANQALLKERIKVIERKDNIGMMEVILNTNDMKDLLSSSNNMEKVVNYDKNIIQQLEQDKQLVEELKAQQEAEKRKQDSLKLELEGLKKELESNRSEQTEIRNRLANDITAMEEQENALESESKNLERQIQAFEAEQARLAKEAEEARIRKEAEAKRAAERKAAEAKQQAQKSSTKKSNNSVTRSKTSEDGASADTGKDEAEAKKTPKAPVSSGSLGYPLETGARISSGYGYRIHPIFNTRKMHTGTDFAIGSGTNILASDGGTVISAYYAKGYGNLVVISHGNGLSTAYAHCSKLLVSAGQKVSKGQVVAKVGSTGNSTGPHLHFEVRKNGATTDPMSYLN